MNRRDFLKIIPLATLAGCAAATGIPTTVSRTPTRTRTPTQTRTPTPTLSPTATPTVVTPTKFNAVSVIQQMINDAVISGSYHVTIPAGAYDITETIICAPRVAMDLTGVVLRVRADVDVIVCKPLAHIKGGFIDCSLVPFTHSALVFNGSDIFQIAFPTHIQDMQLMGNWDTVTRNGTAINMTTKVNGGWSYIYGVTFSNIGICYFKYGLFLDAEVGTAETNANQFNNISMQTCDDFIWIGERAGGNLFSNIQIQPNATPHRALYCAGGTNMFNNLFIWDWWEGGVSEQHGIELTSTSRYNMINTNLYSAYYLDNGLSNKFSTPF